MIDYRELSKEFLSRTDRIKEQVRDPEVAVSTGFNQTLFDTSSFRYPTMRDAMMQLGLPPHIADLTIGFRGQGERYTLGAAIHVGDVVDSPMYDEANEILAERERELLIQIGREADLSRYLMPGAAGFVRELRRSRKHANLLTDTPTPMIDLFLERAQVDNRPVEDVFVRDAIRGTDDERIQRLHARSGVSEDESGQRLSSLRPQLIVGDNFSDAVLAHKTGGNALIVSPDLSLRKRLNQSYGQTPNITIVDSLQGVFL